MVRTKQATELERFAERLNELCDDFHLPKHGRQTEIAKWVERDQTAVAKWFHGTGYPSLGTAIVLSKRFECSVEWLLTGRGGKKIAHTGHRYAEIAVAVMDKIYATHRGNWPSAAKIHAIEATYEILHDAPGPINTGKLNRLIEIWDAWSKDHV